MNIGKMIAEMRNKQKWTQQELASKLYVTDKTISSWEQNRTEPSLDLIVRMGELFNCSPSQLIFDNIKKNDIETEIKIKLSKREYDDMKILLESSKFISETRQIDTYYEPKYRPFLKSREIDEWLRIGIRGNKKILNYKHWYDNKYCDEYEVEIDSDTSLEKIFKVLDINPIVVVDKTRCTYRYLDKYEIALDYVQNLGYFIEIEVKEYSEDPFSEYDNLLNLAIKLGLDLKNIDKRGYPYHLLYQ